MAELQADLSPTGAEILAVLITRFGGEEEALNALSTMSATEINTLIYAAQAQTGHLGTADGLEVRRVVLDEIATRAVDTHYSGNEWVPDPDLADDRPDDSLPRGDVSLWFPSGEAPSGEMRLTTRRERSMEALREEERRSARNAYTRERSREGQTMTAGEAREARLRASGAYRQLIDRHNTYPFSEEAANDPNFDPREHFRGDPLGGPVGDPTRGGAIPVNPEAAQAEVQEQFRGGGMSVDRAARQAANAPDERFALYYPGDEYAPAGWTEQRIAQMQRRLIEAGLLQTTFRRGYWDGATADAYAGLLAAANETGDTWNAALPHVQRAFEQGVEVDRAQAVRQFRMQLPAYTPEDPASLRQLLREEIRSRVHRDPSNAELATYSAELNRYYRAQYDAEVAEARAAIDRQVDAMSADPRADLLAFQETGEMPTAETSGGAVVPPANAPAVSPADRIAEMLEQRLGAEMNLFDDKDRAAQSQQAVSTIAGGLMSRVRRG